MKTTISAMGLLAAAFGLAFSSAFAATNDLTSAIQRGLFEEEANQNLGAAIQAYQTVANQFDKDRKLAATAIFRLGECYRKQGNTNAASEQYKRVLREFSDQPTLVTLSRQNLASLGSALPAPATPVVSDAAQQEQKRLLEEEIALVQKQLGTAQKQVQAGVMPPDSVVPIERDLLKLKRQLAGLDASQPVLTASADAAANAAAQAEADLLTLDTQIAAFKGLPKDKMSAALTQNYPNPVLETLMSRQAKEEQNLAALEKTYGPQHTEVVVKKAELDTINKQIDEQVEAALRGLEIKRNIAASIAKRFQARMGAAPAQRRETATESEVAPSSDADEVKRIQALIKDSPDLINAPNGIGETLLESAAGKGNMAVVKLLLENGAAVNGLQRPGLTALHYAAGNGHKAVVDLLLSKGAKPDARTEGGVTPLHLAAQMGYESVIKALLAAGAPVNAKNTEQEGRVAPPFNLHYQLSHSGQTPLHLAASAGFAGAVELLLAKGADVNAVDDPGRTPLSYVVEGHYEPIVQLLLAAHANPNAGSSDLPLTEAAYYGEMPALKLLLANGADPNINTNLGGNFSGVFGLLAGSGGNVTPLGVAVVRQHPEAVAELIGAKADPNGFGPDGTPLIFPALRDTPTLKALLEGGAESNRANRQGVSPLCQAVLEDKPAAVEVLLAYKADFNAGRTDNGWTPLQMAADRGYKSAAELLLKAGADVNAVNKDGWEALCLAVLNKHRDLAELLLAHAADPNAKDRDGQTPLYHAVMSGQRDMAELLLANKADPNAKDKNGETPLHLAVSTGQRDVAELLLAGQADPNEQDNLGRTPLDLAKSQVQQAQPGQPGMPPFPGRRPSAPYAVGEQERKHDTMAELLRRHGALDDLPHLDRIGVRRTAVGYSETAFAKPAQDWSHFTLLELLAVQYSFLAASPNDGGGSGYSASAFVHTFSRLPFPDLAHLHISRPARDLKSWHDEVVDLTPVLESGDCAKDVPLEWGDVVEIPEADHPLYEAWDGFSREEVGNLKKCLTRKVEIVIKGQVTPVTLAPQISGLERSSNIEPTITARTPYWLRPVLLQSRLVLISSDLSRVKVIRRDPSTGQEREWIVDCSKAGEFAPDLWLEDGDRIEVPEKTYASAASQAEATQPAAPRIAQLRAAAELRARSLPEARPVGNAAQFGVAPQAGAPLYYQWCFSQPQAAQVVEAPEAATKPQPEDSGVRYSPKTADAELLNEGYHRDRSARTRKAEYWEQRARTDLSGRGGNAVWTGTELIEFGGEGMGTSFGDGARYCFAENTWAGLPRKGEPSSRTAHAMVWTGKEMIVWGGFGGVWGNDTIHDDGARYNPSSDTWKPMTNKNAPSARLDFPAVWTGREMLLWGGFTDTHSRYQGYHAHAQLNTGGRYDPSSDSWKSIAAAGAPSKRCCHTLVWTGKEAIVWGGCNATKALNDGARYNPSRDSWKPISSDGAPSPRLGHVAFWTGKEMIVWGGTTRETDTQGTYFENGARYNPETDTWKSISTLGAPKGRVIGTAVWTGTEMIVWGGANDAQAQEGMAGFDPNRYLGTGARYNPATDTWTEMTLTGAPLPRVAPSGVWTGEGLLFFGGYNGTHLNDTWFYSPARTLYPYAKG